MEKKISVIVPNYNYEKFIEERLNTIVNQKYPIYELVILDDCSTDNSVAKIEKFISKHKDMNIKFIKNKKNSGCVFLQWKKGIENITGDYFWIAEADDSASPDFLKTVITAFDDPDVVLSFSHTATINTKSRIIDKYTIGFLDIFKSGKFEKDFIMDGNEFIKNYLAISNNILNVSSVVWKKDDYHEILTEAEKYKVAGDWYIYANVLRDKKIAYFKTPLSMQRKHLNSVSTTVKKDLEFDEDVKIQEMVNSWFKPSRKIIYQQQIRRSFMAEELSPKKRKEVVNFERKKIAIIFPYPVKGSGGHRTVIQNANALVRYGHDVDIYVGEDFVSTNKDMKKMIEKFYGKCLANVFVGIKMNKDYDLIFATAWTTAEAVRYLDAPLKAYFIQDYEPWFEPMGNNYIKAENSYSYGFNFITIGKWLSYKMHTEFNQPVRYFDFCADLKVYRPIEVEKENAICFIYQPEKFRRCADLGVRALEIVKKIMPDVKIYLYGSNTEGSYNFEAENLHIIPIEKCNEIYNRCKVGLCISSSNPSRIPFEMMSAGLPVVELYRENNLYDMPDSAILLAESNPEALATAILKILRDDKLQKKMSAAGVEYMKNKDLNYGFEQFTSAVADLFEGNFDVGSNIKKSYNLKPIVAAEETKITDGKDLYDFYVSKNGPIKRKIIKAKRFMKRVLIKIIGRR